MSEFERDSVARKLAVLESRVDAAAVSRHALAAARLRPRSIRMRAATIAVGAIALLLLSSTAVGYNWFTEVFRIGDLFAAASRPVTLAEARTTGLPVPSSSELPGGWRLHDKGAVQLTRTPEWTTVQLQYDRAGQRGMNVTLASGLGLFDPSRVRHDEVLNVSGAPVYVSRERDDGYDYVNAFFNVGDVDVEIFAFGPALVDRTFTNDEISELVRVITSN